jgi:hypothetical protein
MYCEQPPLQQAIIMHYCKTFEINILSRTFSRKLIIDMLSQRIMPKNEAKNKCADLCTVGSASRPPQCIVEQKKIGPLKIRFCFTKICASKIPSVCTSYFKFGRKWSFGCTPQNMAFTGLPVHNVDYNMS